MFDKETIMLRFAKAKIDQLANDEHAEAPVKALILIFVVAVLAGALLPVGINSLIAGKNSSGTWSASETATYGIISIMIVIAVILLVVRMATE